MILFVEPFESTLFNFRKELLDTLINKGFEIVLCTEKSNRTNTEYSSKVRQIIELNLNLKSVNPFENLKTKRQYKKIINKVKPDLIISYMIKPNIFCGIYAKNIPMIANITGLGSAFNKKGILSRISIYLYRKSFKNVSYVLFQNQSGYEFFVKNKITINNYKIIPGSGVNTSKFHVVDINTKSNLVNFLFASRASVVEKGFSLLVNSIPNVVLKNKNIHFNFLVEQSEIELFPKEKKLLEDYKDYITILPRTNDMVGIYGKNDFLVSPSYYNEGISNVLLESLSCGRPIITTNDNPGCKEVLEEGVNGFGVCSKDKESLEQALIRASYLPKQQIFQLGLNGRKIVESKFNREIVINDYLSIIYEISSILKHK